MIKYFIIIPLIIAVSITAISFYLQPNDFIGCREKPSEGTKCAKVDAIVAVSGGDTTARTDEAIALYENGWADMLIFSGAAQDKSGPSNAAAMRIHALEEGVRPNVIFIDESSETTQENAENTKSIFENHNVDSVILVTSGYHQRRAALEFEKRAENVKIYNHPVIFDKDWSAWWWLTPRGWWLAGGELVKVIAFYIQGARI